MFFAAFISRSNLTEQFLQVQTLSDSFRFLLILPQLLQRLELGSNLPITERFLPLHSHLYSNIVLKVLQEASAIRADIFFSFNILSTDKSSIQIVSNLLTS